MPYAERMPAWKRDKARAMRHQPTAAEAALWQAVRRKAFGVRFHRQSRMLGYIVDFYCPAARLVVECDGSAHDDRAPADAYRDAVLRRYGFTVLRVSNRQVLLDLQSVLRLIAKELS